MGKSVKINNILFDNVLFVEKGESTIFAKDMREEFFGVYNLNVAGKNILCEGKSGDVVICNVSVGNNVFENTPLKVKRSEKNQIVINLNDLNNKESYICEDVKKDVYDDLLLELKENKEKSKQELELIVEKAIMEKKKLSNEIVDLKKQIKQIEISNQKLLTEGKDNSHREELLNEFFHIKNQNDQLIEEKIESIHESIMESVEDRLKHLSKEASIHFKELNEIQTQKMMDVLKKDILENGSRVLEEKLLELEQSYSDEMNEKLNAYSKTSGIILEDFKKAKKDTESVLENSSKIFEEKVSKLKDFYSNQMDEKLHSYSKITGKVLEDFNKAKEDTKIILEKNLNESLELLKENFNQSFEKYTHEFKKEYSEKFENIIKQEKGNIKNQSNQLLEKQKKKIEDLLEYKSKEIDNKSNDILLEASKKIKDVSKKLENIEKQVNTKNLDRKKMDSIIQDAKRYTDTKMEMVLNEAKRFTRIMMDMVGGGSGSVAVQYAAGGTIGGDLTVTGALSSNSVDVGNLTFTGGTIEGDLNIGGTIVANTILSGGRDLTEIFAGEGEGDTNLLNGGLF